MATAKLEKKSMDQLQERISKLESQGVKATTEASGELNMSGCATGYCMAWD